MADYQVGQELYFVPNSMVSRRESPHTVTITKVGRKWLTLSNYYRVDRDDLRADGGNYSSPGRCWLSQEEYEKACRLALAWEQFKLHLQNIPRPAMLTLDKIREARRVLGMESEGA